MQVNTTIIRPSWNRNIGIPVVTNVNKADEPLTNKDKEGFGEYTLVSPRIPLEAYKEMSKNSSIVPQCVNAYKQNISGFGIDAKYKKTDFEELPEAKEELEHLSNILKYINYDMPFKNVIENIIENREESGIGYMEVIRDINNNVVEVHSALSEYIQATTQGELMDVPVAAEGQTRIRRKRFRKYIQNINGEMIWFKEFGCPKFMNYRTGEFTKQHNGVLEANELLPFKLGSDLYGMPRWYGQVTNVQGAQMAEFMNYNYFNEGRHTPVMIIVKGGTLSDKSWQDLQSYMNDIKGYKNAHGFIVLEVEKLNEGVQGLDLTGEDGNKVDVEIKDLSPMLQHDELFQEYLNNTRKKIQSSFNLPDIYVGYSSEFNRATAYASIEITEKQVFQPQRESFAWILNNVLLGEYNFKYVELYFKAPQLTNIDDLAKILNVIERAGGVTPAAAQDMYNKYTDTEQQAYTGEWSQKPLALQQIQGQQSSTETSSLFKSDNIDLEIRRGFCNQERTVDILKDMRIVLEKLNSQIKD